MGYPQRKHAEWGKKNPVEITCVVMFVYDGVAPRSAIAAQITTEVAVVDERGVTHSRIEENHKLYWEILHNVGFANRLFVLNIGCLLSCCCF